MSVILVLAGFLAHAIEAFTQAVTAGQQAFALLVVGRHGIQGILQLQTRLTQLLMLDFALFAQLQQLAIQAGTAQYQLFDLSLPGRQLSLQLAETTGQVLRLAALLLALFFLSTLVVAQMCQTLIKDS